ncbi:hypothetical protein F5J12DRAFT_779981 [Pisolithus orientalis]|uniref:uncharacterized protein n=1 Tax=Pisolithus orientalis TaxID=936130 RepID=UPI002225A792|nr:uncharacterized protein F5J12DRAFT_779981 [Pisolithus orientalis]KAI6028263.1 hypothetical protein F5J12DRAFT_779981 [Pisolithus orientalis]
MFETLPTPLRTPTCPCNPSGPHLVPAVGLDMHGSTSMYDIVHQAVLNGIPLDNIYYSMILVFARNCTETVDAVYVEQQHIILKIEAGEPILDKEWRIFSPLQVSCTKGLMELANTLIEFVECCILADRDVLQ